MTFEIIVLELDGQASLYSLTAPNKYEALVTLGSKLGVGIPTRVSGELYAANNGTGFLVKEVGDGN